MRRRDREDSQRLAADLSVYLVHKLAYRSSRDSRCPILSFQSTISTRTNHLVLGSENVSTRFDHGSLLPKLDLTEDSNLWTSC
jgi:hypothetical protein